MVLYVTILVRVLIMKTQSLHMIMNFNHIMIKNMEQNHCTILILKQNSLVDNFKKEVHHRPLLILNRKDRVIFRRKRKKATCLKHIIQLENVVHQVQKQAVDMSCPLGAHLKAKRVLSPSGFRQHKPHGVLLYYINLFPCVPGEIMSSRIAHSRQSSRLRDIAESQNLLLELMTTEPTVLQCLKIVESTCLSQGIACSLQGQEVSESFQSFLEDHYAPFCKEAIRAMFTYGFVPWRVRKILSGDDVPEVLPPGTFSWRTEIGAGDSGVYRHENANPAARKSCRPCSDDSRLVVYRVTPTAGSLREEDVRIYTFVPASLDISVNSNLYATVPSPVSYLLTDYKNLREAQKRRSHADAWNTTARIVSTFKPTLRVEDNPTQYLMDFVHEKHFAPPSVGQGIFPQFEAYNVWQREQVMRRQFMDTPSNHHPEVYALPRDHDVVPQARLEPCEDIGFLMDKYRRDVSSLLGVPHDMIVGRDHGSHETVKKTVASGRLFLANMREICRHVQMLLRDVYCDIYGEDPFGVQFSLTPMPRLEIESVEDIKVLHEIGALTPDLSMRLSRVLVGEDPFQNDAKRRKVQAKNESKAMASAGNSGKDEKNRKDGKDEKGGKDGKDEKGAKDVGVQRSGKDRNAKTERGLII